MVAWLIADLINGFLRSREWGVICRSVGRSLTQPPVRVTDVTPVVPCLALSKARDTPPALPCGLGAGGSAQRLALRLRRVGHTTGCGVG